MYDQSYLVSNTASCPLSTASEAQTSPRKISDSETGWLCLLMVLSCSDGLYFRKIALYGAKRTVELPEMDSRPAAARAPLPQSISSSGPAS